jgi:hypothetical protein
MPLCLLIGPLVALNLAACSAGRPIQARPSSDVITREELTGQGLANAYEAVQRLRPAFLRSRGPVSVRDPRPAMPLVYVNGVRYGEPQTLRNLRVQEVEEIRFISATDATTRWGTGHTGGVIEVMLRRSEATS